MNPIFKPTKEPIGILWSGVASEQARIEDRRTGALAIVQVAMKPTPREERSSKAWKYGWAIEFHPRAGWSARFHASGEGKTHAHAKEIAINTAKVFLYSVIGKSKRYAKMTRAELEAMTVVENAWMRSELARRSERARFLRMALENGDKERIKLWSAEEEIG